MNKVEFIKVTETYFAVFFVPVSGCVNHLGRVELCSIGSVWEFIPDEPGFFSKYQINEINTFMQGLKDPVADGSNGCEGDKNE